MLLLSIWLPLTFLFSIIISWYSSIGVQYFRLGAPSEVRKESINVLQTTQLSKRKTNVPKFMWDLFHNEDHKHQFRKAGIDVIKSIPPKSMASVPLTLLSSGEDKRYHHHILIFQLPPTQRKVCLQEAEIKIMLANCKELIEEIKLFIVEDETNYKYLNYKYFNSDWISFNTTSILKSRKWYSTLKFLLKITPRSGVLADLLDLYSMEPILILSYSAGDRNQNIMRYMNRENSRYLPYYKNSRKKRDVDIDEYEEDTNIIWDDDISEKASKKMRKFRNTCRRKPLYIEFSEISYDTWIVAPSGYEAYQCVGKCFFPVSEHLSPTKHAILQTLVHNAAPRKASRACCVPTRLDSISVLYVDNRGVLTYRFSYQEMVVAECGCR